MNIKLPAGFARAVFFHLSALMVFGLLAWQLWELEPPSKYCPVTNLSICYTSIIRGLDIRDHAIIGLMAVWGIVVIGGMVSLYKLQVSAGTDQFHVDVKQDQTVVTTPSGTVNVPTAPPANGEK